MTRTDYWSAIAAIVLAAFLGLGYAVVCVSALLWPDTPSTEAIENATDGSVIFWHDSLLVKPIYWRTGSTITHAAILLGGYVYEAVPPRVHKMPLDEYKKHLAAKRIKWFLLKPKKAFASAKVKAMTAYAESQLGRPYMLRGWWKGHEVRGIFCSQLVANTLETSDLIVSGNIRESPGSLYRKLLPLYDGRQ